jgi:AcrR family transcriptional regulator
MLALGAQMSAAQEAEYDARSRFLALGRAYVRFGLTRPQRYRLLFGGQCPGAALTAQLEALRGDGDAPDPYALLSSGLDALRAAHELTAAPSVGAEVMAWATVHGLVSLWLSGRVDGTHAEAERMADALCRALLRGWA